MGQELTDLETLQKIVKKDKDRNVIDLYLRKWKKTGHLGFVKNLYTQHERFALKAWFLDKELQMAKQHFYVCGKLDEFLVKKHNAIMLTNKMTHILLSDNDALIGSYANLDSKAYERNAYVTFPMMQNVIKQDFDKVKGNIEVYTNLINKTKGWNKRFYELCRDFGIAMIERNPDLIIKVLQGFVEPKFHKKRKLSYTLDLLPTPENGFAKLAWRLGMEVKVDSQLIPKELLPIMPNASYELPYDFLLIDNV